MLHSFALFVVRMNVVVVVVLIWSLWWLFFSVRDSENLRLDACQSSLILSYTQDPEDQPTAVLHAFRDMSPFTFSKNIFHDNDQGRLYIMKSDFDKRHV
jgi:hypothetical protein